MWVLSKTTVRLLRQRVSELEACWVVTHYPQKYFQDLLLNDLKILILNDFILYSLVCWKQHIEQNRDWTSLLGCPHKIINTSNDQKPAGEETSIRSMKCSFLYKISNDRLLCIVYQIWCGTEVEGGGGMFVCSSIEKENKKMHRLQNYKSLIQVEVYFFKVLGYLFL